MRHVSDHTRRFTTIFLTSWLCFAFGAIYKTRRFVRLELFDTAYYAVVIFFSLASIRFFFAWCGVLHSFEPPAAALSMRVLLSLTRLKQLVGVVSSATSCLGLYLSERR
jgi:hypothetical protein